ncbi:hypothetical protein [Streptomyces purpureus]|uniref:Lipoprotein n=1 Tax=Streptomyces purpureus TaxID=1951 RepID=A0A918HHX9_9ACTN|nr:hypothetical protein [Streptomyces purpureus]GGT64607.1 hypothetical protein GCM10014713_67140 [Streptomyces purpureus]
MEIIVRGGLGRTALAAVVLAVLMTATGCAYALRDLGPLPPRFSGPPMAADTAVAEMTSVLAAEGFTVEREPSNVLGRCFERLWGRHTPQTANAALKAAFARARSQYGWQNGPDMGSETLTLTKGNWTVLAGLPTEPAQGLEATVVMSLTCVDAGTPTAFPASSVPELTPEPAKS